MTGFEKTAHEMAISVTIVVGAWAATSLLLDADDVRRHQPHSDVAAIEKVEAKLEVQAPAVKAIRIIPIRRWPLWCERIGGTDCP